MKQISVELGARAYPIYIGEGLLADPALLARHISAKQILIISNEIVAPLYLEPVRQSLPNAEIDTFILPDGEHAKNLKNFNRIISRLLERKYSRSCMIIALGGGVIGDLAGFVAACYQRGARFIQIPTTLLAQVDASVGGKTAVNHPLGKNMIGAFHQPVAVIADTQALDTLPDRELAAGLAEVIKYGLIRDPSFFSWLEANIEALLQRDKQALAHAIERSCFNKAEVVAADEREAGARALLNLGHTFGHAIETALAYEKWLHGEAVACGMLMVADLSARLGLLDEPAVNRIGALLAKTGLPATIHPDADGRALLANMKVDKKAKDGVVFLVLLKAIGEAVLTADYSEDALSRTVNRFLPVSSG